MRERTPAGKSIAFWRAKDREPNELFSLVWAVIDNMGGIPIYEAGL